MTQAPVRPAKPKMLPVRPEAIPEELKARTQWVNWRAVWRQDRPTNGVSREGKWTKVPVNAATGELAATDNPQTWTTFPAAWTAYRRGGFDGIGYVFSAEDPYTGVDLDKCRDPATGEIAAWAAELLALLGGYAEVSPSGTGVKVIVRGALPRDAHGDCRHKLTGLGDDRQGAVELYDCLRYFTLTGHRVETGA